MANRGQARGIGGYERLLESQGEFCDVEPWCWGARATEELSGWGNWVFSFSPRGGYAALGLQMTISLGSRWTPLFAIHSESCPSGVADNPME
jgi:hypothetical protein